LLRVKVLFKSHNFDRTETFKVFLSPLLPEKKREIVTSLYASVTREFLCESLCQNLWGNTDIFALCNNPICQVIYGICTSRKIGLEDLIYGNACVLLRRRTNLMDWRIDIAGHGR